MLAWRSRHENRRRVGRSGHVGAVPWIVKQIGSVQWVTGSEVREKPCNGVERAAKEDSSRAAAVCRPEVTVVMSVCGAR